MMTENHEHRRHAIQVVAALPDDPQDALVVLRAAERIVRTYLVETPTAAPAKLV